MHSLHLDLSFLYTIWITGQDGRKEPVPLQLKVNRSGLGHEKERQRKRQANQQARVVALEKRQKVQQHQVQDYQFRKRSELTDKLDQKDLYNSQKVCHQLDEQKVWRIRFTNVYNSYYNRTEPDPANSF